MTKKTEPKPVKKGVLRSTARALSPVGQSAALIKGPFQRLKGTLARFRESLSTQSGKAKQALKHPPSWASIEELESAWGITDANRTAVIRRLKWLMVGQAILLFVVLTSLLTIDTNNIIIFATSTIVVLSAVACVLTFMTTSMWRYHVLTTRRPVNFVQWLKGQQLSTDQED